MDPRLDNLPRDLSSSEQGPEMLCPFGCGVEQCNDLGYCRHLVGFIKADPGSRVELRERHSGHHERCGYIIRDRKPDDVLVATMKRTRKNRAGQHCPTPTYRVYNKNGKAPVRDLGDGKYERRPESLSRGWKDFQYEDDDVETDAAAAV